MRRQVRGDMVRVGKQRIVDDKSFVALFSPPRILVEKCAVLAPKTCIFAVPVRYPYGTRTVPVRSPV